MTAATMNEDRPQSTAARLLLWNEAWMPSPVDVRRQTADILAELAAEEEEAAKAARPTPSPPDLLHSRKDQGWLAWLPAISVSAAIAGWLLCLWTWNQAARQASEMNGLATAQAETAEKLRLEQGHSAQQAQQLEASLHDNSLLRRALALVAPTDEERNQWLFVNYVDPATLANEERGGEATLHVRNVVLPVVVRWTVGEASHAETIYSGEKSISLPAGRSVSILCEPLIAHNWYQIAAVATGKKGQEKFRGSTLSKITLPIESGDEVSLTCAQPSAPWNAIIVPCRGAWMLVTLERPRADFQIEEWKKEPRPGPEEFANTMLFWAKYGEGELARELAAYFLSLRDKPRKAGHYRGRMHTAITLGSDDDGVIQEPWSSISEEELRQCLLNAFQMLRKQRSPEGRTVEGEIAKAAQILERSK